MIHQDVTEGSGQYLGFARVEIYSCMGFLRIVASFIFIPEPVMYFIQCIGHIIWLIALSYNFWSPSGQVDNPFSTCYTKMVDAVEYQRRKRRDIKGCKMK